MPHPISVRAVSLTVRDLEQTARFYQAAIGLELIEATAGTVRLGAGAVPLLTLLHRPDARPVDPGSAGLFHTAFLLPSRADLGRWLRHAAAQRLAISGAADHLVSEAVYLADPEGNGIEMYADRPSAAWTWEGGQIAMANDRLDLQALAGLDERPWTGAPPGTRIGHVHLQVGDIAAAEPFYAGTLGLAVTRRWPQALFLAAGRYHHHLAVNVWNSRGAGPRDPDRAGLAAITLRADANAPPLTDPWGTAFHFTTDGDQQ